MHKINWCNCYSCTSEKTRVGNTILFAGGDAINAESLLEDKILIISDASWQKLNCGGVNRNVTLPSTTNNKGLIYEF